MDRCDPNSWQHLCQALPMIEEPQPSSLAGTTQPLVQEIEGPQTSRHSGIWVRYVRTEGIRVEGIYVPQPVHTRCPCRDEEGYRKAAESKFKSLHYESPKALQRLRRRLGGNPKYKQASVPDRAFYKVPVEVWGLIAGHLHITDLAILTLTCRSMLYKLGNSSWFCTHPRSPTYLPQAHLPFLRQLAQTMKNHWLCSRCKTWHHNYNLFCIMQRAMRQYIFFPTDAAHVYKPVDESVGRTLMLDNEHGVHYLMAHRTTMALRYGKQKVPHQMGFSNCVDESTGWTHSMDFKLVDHRLLLKCISTKKYKLAGDELVDLVPRPWTTQNEPGTSFLGCTHSSHQVSHFILCISDHLRRMSPGINRLFLANQFTGTRRCAFCPTEFLFNLRPSVNKPGHGVLEVLRWIDLGDLIGDHMQHWQLCASSYFFKPGQVNYHGWRNHYFRYADEETKSARYRYEGGNEEVDGTTDTTDYPIRSIMSGLENYLVLF